jgi:hypothetical protein
MKIDSMLIPRTQVESIFMGMADAMRRQSIPAFAQHLNGIKASGTPEKDIKVLDVATGTGENPSRRMLCIRSTISLTLLSSRSQVGMHRFSCRTFPR